MADNYLQFSEVIPRLSPREVQWLNRQLEVVCVFDGQEFDEDSLPAGKDAGDAEFYGCRGFRDLPEADDCMSGDAGFSYAFGDDDGDDGWGRHLWLYADEYGDVDQVAYLVQKFLRELRPADCWSLTFATTCSKPRVGEFGGGALFVTADDVTWQNAHEFVAAERAAYKKRDAGIPG